MDTWFTLPFRMLNDEEKEQAERLAATIDLGDEAMINEFGEGAGFKAHELNMLVANKGLPDVDHGYLMIEYHDARQKYMIHAAAAAIVLRSVDRLSDGYVKLVDRFNFFIKMCLHIDEVMYYLELLDGKENEGGEYC